MKISTLALLNELKDRTSQHLEYAQTLTLKTEEELNFRTSQDSWSTLECLEHLNRYGNFYIPEISRNISSAGKSPQPYFKPGILGNYFAKSMLPKEKLNKMKTLKTMNPIHSKLNKDVVDTFIKQQERMLELLEAAQDVDLEKIKTSISISKLIKLKLGDTFRFVIYHNLRHIGQIKRILPH
ncbi:DinB family protein [Chryseobacterium viscerum]|uniref:DinB family protein n=1 Tax=Chryseobacterium TaxID=59732 RepID=UPI00222168A2|nr:DinB family protein [Chryseobacterium viscerum]MCW1962651.1 DinB family protein [Chryseobacterium viscerum]WPO89466.1 DinB family protein [Chryseobacterium sp. HR92]